MSYFKPSELWKEVYKNTSPLGQHCLIFGQIIKRIPMGTSKWRLEISRRALVTKCLAGDTKLRCILSLKCICLRWEQRGRMASALCWKETSTPVLPLLLFVPAVPLASSLLTLRWEKNEFFLCRNFNIFQAPQFKQFLCFCQYLPFSLCWPIYSNNS